MVCLTKPSTLLIFLSRKKLQQETKRVEEEEKRRQLVLDERKRVMRQRIQIHKVFYLKSQSDCTRYRTIQKSIIQYSKSYYKTTRSVRRPCPFR